VIVCGGANDFTCLNIPVSNLKKTFDIQDFFKKGSGQYQKSGEEVLQPIHKYRDLKIEITLNPKVNLQEEFDGIQTLQTNYKQLAAEFYRKK
jgi:hypothetical protein